MGMLEGEAAFVTGGGTGIGLASAKRIVAEGGRVALAGRRFDVLEDAARSIGDGAIPVQCDVTNDESVLGAIQTATEQNGPLRLAVNCAYQAMIGSMLATPTDLFAMSVDATLTGTYRSMQAEAKAMKGAGGGSIVNISSVAAARSGRWHGEGDEPRQSPGRGRSPLLGEPCQG